MKSDLCNLIGRLSWRLWFVYSGADASETWEMEHNRSFCSYKSRNNLQVLDKVFTYLYLKNNSTGTIDLHRLYTYGFIIKSADYYQLFSKVISVNEYSYFDQLATFLFYPLFHWAIVNQTHFNLLSLLAFKSHLLTGD